uniref:SHSP domain-containing protein n=1 Tax=Oryza punctata TaxID=4537 RepID=A0A0E0KR40_ORYPU
MAVKTAAVLACIAVLASTAADGAMLPWFGGGGARDEAVPALSEVGLLAAADPFRILEHVPFGFDRDDVAMLSMARKNGGGGDHWHREERSYGRFWRQLRLPDNADLDSIAASLDNGVLTVRFRKLAPDQIKGPRVVGIAGGDDGGKKSIGAGAGGGAGEEQNQQAKKVEL